MGKTKKSELADQFVSVVFTRSEVDALDAARGLTARSMFIRMHVRKALGLDKKKRR